MPFNGAGTFTLVTGNPVVTGTVISSTVHNNTNNDFASGFTNCVTRDGQSAALANLPMGGFKHTGAANATASGQYLVYGQAPTSAQLAASGGAALIGTTQGETVQEVVDATVPDRLLRGDFSLPGTIYFFGDSFWEQPNSHTSSGNSMAYKAAALLGVTGSINATSGNTSADKQGAIFAISPSASGIYCTDLGQNDAQFIGTGSDTERRYNDVALIHLANMFQMGVPAGSRRTLASSMLSAGSWSADTDIAEGGALKSSTNASALQADVADSRYIVIIYKIKAASGGTFKVSIDGTDYYGSFDAAGFHSAPFANIPSNTGQTYARAALVFDTGRRKPLTTVQMIVTSTTNAANVVSICSVIGLSGEPLPGPLMVACDLSDRGALGYATASGSQAAVPVVSRLINQSLAVVGACGVRVVPVALSTALDPNTDLDTDQFHPNEDGANAGAQAIQAAITGAAQNWSVQRPDLDAQSLVNGANGYVLLSQLPVVLGPDGLWKRQLMSPRAINWDNDVVPVATSIRVVFKDGSGSYNSNYALYLAREANNAGVAYAGNIGNGDFVLLADAALKLRLSSAALAPETTGGLQLGSTSKRFSSGWFSDVVITQARTVSQLPSAATFADARTIVTDATATTFASVVAGGGANRVPVYSDGTNWRIG